MSFYEKAKKNLQERFVGYFQISVKKAEILKNLLTLKARFSHFLSLFSHELTRDFLKLKEFYLNLFT